MISMGDYEMLEDWWKAHKMQAPARDMTPSTTFITTKASTPYLSVALFLTNTSLAWVDNLIGNPSVDKSLRRDLVKPTLDYISNYAANLGFNKLFCMSIDPRTSRRYRQLGFVETCKNVNTFVKEIK